MKRHNQLATAIAMLATVSVCAGCVTTHSTGVSNSMMAVSNNSSNSTVSNTTPSSKPVSPSAQLASPVLTSIHMVNSKNGWATGRNAVWYTNDGGVHWRNITPKKLTKTSSNLQMEIYGIDDHNAWLGIDGRTSFVMYHTTDKGQLWSKQQIHDSGEPISLHFRNQGHGWLALQQGAAAGSDRETIYQTSDGGNRWNKISTTTEVKGGTLTFGGDKTGVSFVSSERGWATGTDGANGHIFLYQTKDDGRIWNPQPLPVASKFEQNTFTSYPPTFFSSKKGVLPVQILGAGGLIVYRTTDGGNTWIQTVRLRSTLKNENVHLWSFATTNDWFATGGKEIVDTTNGGQSWKSISPNITFGNVKQIDFVSSTDGWALMDSGLLYHTTDGGQKWKKIS